MTESRSPRPVDAYFVCGTPRTGSSLLLGLLESTGVAGRPQAYFRRPDEPLWAERWGLARRPDGGFDYGDYIRAALAQGRTQNGVFGAKLMWGTLDELTANLASVHPALAGDDLALLDRVFGRTAFVYVSRGDTVAQAVSWLQAEQTNTWYLGGSGEIGGVGSGAGTGGHRPSYDAEAIATIVRRIASHDAAWEDWFASVRVEPHRVRYEDIDADHTAVVEGILGHLGLELPADAEITPRHRRQADGLNEEWTRRYRAERDLGCQAARVACRRSGHRCEVSAECSSQGFA
ncbi:Stf0 family sulfotransferase [Glycomyces tarimensis]